MYAFIFCFFIFSFSSGCGIRGPLILPENDLQEKIISEKNSTFLFSQKETQ